MPQSYIYLIPGFFGFSDLGGITYFHHVRDLLIEDFKAKGLEAKVVEVDTLPTSSIRKRAAKLFETISQTWDGTSDIFLVGHSTGGLDARLLVTPNAALRVDETKLETIANKVSAVVTVATPHYGTPIASFFSSVLGSQLLYLLSFSTVYTMESGRLPLSILLSVGKFLTRFDDMFGFDNSILDQFYDRLFADFSDDKQDKIEKFLTEVKKDRSLLGQLTPGGVDLLNAATEDRDSVRYASVIVKARRPGWEAMKRIGFDPYRQASHNVYRFLHYLVGDDDVHYPEPTDQQANMLKKTYGEIPDGTESDGVVPTRSQLWGEVIYADHGDHLDVCGHFDDFKQHPPHHDWIATGSSFKRHQFEALWGAVADFMLRAD